MTDPSKPLRELLEGLELAPGASREEIEAVQAELGTTLPADYQSFLKFSKGAAGELAGSYVEFWPVGELVEENREYHVEEFVPGLVLIGSDGAGDAYAFDSREDAPATWVRVPFMPMEFGSTEPMAEHV